MTVASNGQAVVTGRVLIETIRREWRVLLPLAGSFLALGVLLAIMVPSKYESRAVLLPASDRGDLGRLGSLAATVGLSVSAGAPGTLSPELFQTLIKSNYLLEQLLERSYPMRSLDGRSAQLSELLGGANSDERIEKLGEVVSVSYDRIVGLLEVSVTTRDPRLSKALLDTAVVILEEWTSRLRRQEAVQLRDFVSARIDSVRVDLAARRSALERFLVQNRVASGLMSPRLGRQLEELQLEVRLREAAYTTLVQQLELARMDAARDMPLLRVLDPPRELVEPSGPNRKLIALLGMVGAMAVLVVGGWLRA